MIKLVIFDLDGVLVDSRDIHYNVLNAAIEKVAGREYIIDRNEHFSQYDGLPTTDKLRIITQLKGLEEKFHEEIHYLKQKWTIEALKTVPKSPKLIEICEYLKTINVQIACASNAVWNTIIVVLEALGIKQYFDTVVSNQDIVHPKPYPEMFWQCMIDSKALPGETLIVEDSEVGKQAARNSGGRCMFVASPEGLTLERLKQELDVWNGNGK
jgi:HAD superfamily hydrolase (TIGR01509 family)